MFLPFQTFLLNGLSDSFGPLSHNTIKMIKLNVTSSLVFEALKVPCMCLVRMQQREVNEILLEFLTQNIRVVTRQLEAQLNGLCLA
jgi:hypothetical protein